MVVFLECSVQEVEDRILEASKAVSATTEKVTRAHPEVKRTYCRSRCGFFLSSAWFSSNRSHLNSSSMRQIRFFSYEIKYLYFALMMM